MTDDRLAVWLRGRMVATAERGNGDSIRLRYTDDAVGEQAGNLPLLSCSLLLGTNVQDATAFVEGLLPEGDARRYLADRARLAAHDAFGLIARYGRDIAGAVQFVDLDTDPTDSSRWRVETLDSAALDDIVADLPTHPLALVDESELSLAGLQDKMLLVRHDGGWARPLGGQPSTHILKRDSTRHPGIVRAEADALALARAVGLTESASWVEQHGDVDCLIVERFDRIVDSDGSVVSRRHQEDACQALGVPPTRKYEMHHGGGGPDLTQIAALLDRFASGPARQLDRLAAVTAFTTMIGNADAHGKNVAFLLAEDGTIALAPVYDVVPTVLFPKLRRDAAMSVGAAVSFEAIDLAAIEREARRWRHSPRSASVAARACAESMLDAVGRGVVNPEGPLGSRVARVAAKFLVT